jgi:hypothetical protein
LVLHSGEEHRLGVSGNKVLLRMICRHKRDEVGEEGEEICIMRSFMIWTSHQISFKWPNQEE